VDADVSGLDLVLPDNVVAGKDWGLPLNAFTNLGGILWGFDSSELTFDSLALAKDSSVLRFDSSGQGLGPHFATITPHGISSFSWPS
jgi:hypothetical protein